MLNTRWIMTESQQSSLFNVLKSVSVWKRGGQRAPHKPLLLLMAIAAVQRGEPRLRRYDDIEGELKLLLSDFGPKRKVGHPEYPFWRLRSDGAFWDIPESDQAIAESPNFSKSGNIPAGALRKVNARGGFSQSVFELIGAKSEFASKIISEILAEHFPTSVHDDLLDAVGMMWQPLVMARRPRTLQFREDLIRLYEHRCAVCGFDGRLGLNDLALEAAHIHWHSHGGPDDPENGILLCALHHKALDRGAIGLTEARTISVSQDLHGGAQVHNTMTRFCGEPLRAPQNPALVPARKFIGWHRNQVFRDPPRVEF